MLNEEFKSVRTFNLDQCTTIFFIKLCETSGKENIAQT